MRSVPKENYNNNKEQLLICSSVIEEKLCNAENINADQNNSRSYRKYSQLNFHILKDNKCKMAVIPLSYSKLALSRTIVYEKTNSWNLTAELHPLGIKS